MESRFLELPREIKNIGSEKSKFEISENIKSDVSLETTETNSKLSLTETKVLRVHFLYLQRTLSRHHNQREQG